jgi:uncharacterized phage protein (TIGR02220 family)
MAASVRIEDEAFADERYEDLALAAGLADADHARGKMARIWRQCTIENQHALPFETIRRILGERGIDALRTARLGDVLEDGRVRIRGTRGRIEWLEKLRKNGRKGGRPKITKCKPSGSAELNPPAPAPAPTRSKIPPIPPLGGVVDGSSDSGSKPRTKPRKPSGVSDLERATALRVLGKITERTGVTYRSEVHVSLVTHRLREAIAERDLRAVIAYCWDDGDGLAWRTKTDGDGKPMAVYLRPETLFGPRKIHQYLPQATAWREKHFPDQPTPVATPDPIELGNLFARTEAS